MPKASPIQNSFNAGELSPQLIGRIDLEKYRNGCKVLENFIPQIHGPAKKRPGTRFVREVKDSTKNTKLFSFEYGIGQAYVLEFGDKYIRFFKDGGIILNVGVPYEITTPYGHLELGNIQTTQSADVMFIVHPDHPPYELLRKDDTDWTLQEIEFVWPVFADENFDRSVTLTASDTLGTITLTASSAMFSADDVGSHIKISEKVSNHRLWIVEDGTAVAADAFLYYDQNLYRALLGAGSPGTGSSPLLHTEGVQSDDRSEYRYWNTGAGYIKITAYTSTTVVTGVVQSPKGVDTYLPPTALTGTHKWSRSQWSETNGYPRSIAFYEDRLWFGGSESNPQTLWGSVSSDYKNHFYGTVDDDALNYTINSQKINPILWMSPGKVLAVGTAGGEFIVSASSLNEAITPTNIRIVPQTTYGSAQIEPFKIGSSVLFVQRGSQKVRELTYDFQTDGYNSPDMTLLAEHFGENRFIDMTFQQNPNQVVWFVDGGGQLLGMTYERNEDVVGWHKHTVGGEIKAVTVIPHWDGVEDSLWMVVERTINGSVVRYIEYLEENLSDTHAFFVDCGLTYDGAPATTISGLVHLEGRTVSVLTDGAAHPDRVVTSGAITLEQSSSVVVIGLPYTATIETMPIEAGAADGIAQGKRIRVNNIAFRFFETGPGIWYGPNTTDMDEFHPRADGMAMDTPVPLFTGITDILPWPSGYDIAPSIVIQHRIPLPCTVVAIMPQLTTYDR